MYNVVVSRYKRNVDFVYEIEDVNVIVYDKEKPENPHNIPVNRGNEASVYLKYIVDYYDTLPEFTFFIHDENRSWHHTGTIKERFLEAKESKQLFYNINHHRLGGFNHIAPNHKKRLMEWYNEFIEPYIPFSSLPNKDWLVGYKGCAQFLVHKSLIKALPLVFYKNLYDWIITFDTGKLSGYFLEWTWHLFWVIYPTIENNRRLSNAAQSN
jgi:hypothetical protein